MIFLRDGRRFRVAPSFDDEDLSEWKAEYKGSGGGSLGTAGGQGVIDLDVAAAGNTDVVRAKLKVMNNLGLEDSIEDILITLTTQYHLIRILEKDASLFMYVVLGKNSANLAMARYKLTSIERSLTV